MKQVVNEEKRESHLCVDCAAEEAAETGMSWPGPSFHQLLGGLLGSEGAWKGFAGGDDERGRCPNCGLTFADFRRLGHFGCSQCYETFAEPLDPMLRRIQGGTTHSGKIPVKAAGALRMRRQRERLEQKLQDLIVREEYEQAAVVRDKLRALEQEPLNGRVEGVAEGKPDDGDDERDDGRR